MNKKFILSLAAAVPFIITGCGTDMHYVQTGDKEQIISSKINIQDYETAANAAVSDLLASGTLDRVPTPPALVYVSHIINNTGQQIDTDLLTQRITQTLLNSHKAVITTTDPKAADYAKMNNFVNDTQARKPDFTLSGKIIETVDRAGDMSRHTYTFQLSLNDTVNGYQVWQKGQDIGKQGTRSSVGF